MKFHMEDPFYGLDKEKILEGSLLSKYFCCIIRHHLLSDFVYICHTNFPQTLYSWGIDHGYLQPQQLLLMPSLLTRLKVSSVIIWQVPFPKKFSNDLFNFFHNWERSLQNSKIIIRNGRQDNLNSKMRPAKDSHLAFHVRILDFIYFLI